MSEILSLLRNFALIVRALLLVQRQAIDGSLLAGGLFLGLLAIAGSVLGAVALEVLERHGVLGFELLGILGVLGHRGFLGVFGLRGACGVLVLVLVVVNVDGFAFDQSPDLVNLCLNARSHIIALLCRIVLFQSLQSCCKHFILAVRRTGTLLQPQSLCQIANF